MDLARMPQRPIVVASADCRAIGASDSLAGMREFLAAVLLWVPFAGSCSDSTQPGDDTTDVSVEVDAEHEVDAELVPDAELVLDAVAPAIVDPLGHSQLVVLGRGFDAASITAVTVGGIPAISFQTISDGELHVVTAAVEAGPGLDLVVYRGDASATLAGAIEAWSPAELEGARVFDAASGLVTEGAATSYEWQRLTADLAPRWRARDGNTLTWLPATGRYWSVAGWNGYQEPEGFSSVPPDTVYPPENTTNEVWSSPDGVTWTLELPHGHGQFVRRHSHNTMLFKDKLWMIGGDFHTGDYNHDVVSSPDGVTWTVELGPGKTPPPWSARVLQVSGVYAGKLWTVGGQDVNGDLDAVVHHNDVWSSDDGVDWTQVAGDAPASDTRWAGCGVLDGLVEFRGRMWLVGCARERSDAQGHTMYNDVWSTRDGITWQRHAEPPWKGKIWQTVVVWDDKLWILFGYTYGDPANGWGAGNANEAWYSEDGESWRALPPDMPVPGSHAQGVAVTPEQILLAGGNYNYGFGDGVDNSVWRLVAFHGEVASTWSARGHDALVASAPTPANRPLRVADAFGSGRAGLQFDGSTSILELAADDTQDGSPSPLGARGRSVFWVARAPYLPPQYGWIDTYNPACTVVGGAVAGGFPETSVGMQDGRLSVLNREEAEDELGSPTWQHISADAALQEATGAVRLAGFTHTVEGTLQLVADGAPIGPPSPAYFGPSRSWSRIGGGFDGGGEGPLNRFGGTLGAVIVLPFVADEGTLQRVHAWARGRFGAE